ncbi:MAG: hypothetical protein E7254_09035 [Lachnospiraceae bacterium]|nr:hypothetical protein [Lachnospiraceae bacterium]
MKKNSLISLVLAVMLSVTCVQPVQLNEIKTVQAATVKKANKPEMNKKVVTLVVGKKVKLKLINAKAKKVKWKSSNEKIATVKKGVVRAKQIGKVKITAKYKGKKYKSIITVTMTKNEINQCVDMVDYFDDGKNIMFSPLSLNMVLGMVANASGTKAKKEIEKYFGCNIKNYNGAVDNFIKDSMYGEALKISNGVWYKDNYELLSSFDNKVSAKYKAEVNPLNFDDTNGAANEINKWCNEKTDGLIQEIVGPGSFSPSLRALFINAIYFKSNWSDTFNKNITKKKKFIDFSGNKKKVKTMLGEAEVYYENDCAIGFGKYYKSGNYSFVAILPKKKGKFTLKELKLEEFLNSKTYKYDVDVEMPRFTYEWNSEEKIDNYMRSHGVRKMYNSASNPLSNLLNIKENIFLSTIMQTCKIEVDEYGTKAAAVTKADLCGASGPNMEVPPRKEVILNRPFAYMIIDNTTNQILFMGKVVEIK